MTGHTITPRERAELVAFAERLERGWAEFGCAVAHGDWPAARRALDTISQTHDDATDQCLDETVKEAGLWGLVR